MSTSVKDVLYNIGYQNISDNGNELRTRPIYRETNNNTVLKIDKHTGKWIDFGTNRRGTLQELVNLTLNINSNNSLLYLKDIDLIEDKSIELKKFIPKIYEDDFDLIQNNEYWNNRGISNNILNLFNGGVSKSGKMKDRYVFPIIQEYGKIFGASGRLLHKSEFIPKWKHVGLKSFWIYPYFNTTEISDKKEIYLVESIGDCLSLFEIGIFNVRVLFGLFISKTMLLSLLKLDLQKIYLVLNNDSEKSNSGNIASEKLKTKLEKHFDKNQIINKLPPQKDLNEMLLSDKKGLIQWINS